MKKTLLILVLFFSFSWCNAQDTIVLRGGDVILSHVSKVNKMVWFTYFVSDSTLLADSTMKTSPSGSINISSVNYIHYVGGKIQTFTNKEKKEAVKSVDSSKMKLPQDTIYFWSGARVTANIVKMGYRIYLQNYHDLYDNEYYVKKYEVHSIYYSDGRVVNWKPRDTIERKFFLSADGGISIPKASNSAFSSYGKDAPLPSNFSNINENDGNGTHFDINFGYKFHKAFNLVVMVGEDMNPDLNNNLSGGKEYNLTQFLVGFGLSTNEATHNFSARMEWLAGLAMANFPSFSTSTQNGTSPYIYTISTNTINLSGGKGIENYIQGTLEYKPGPVWGIHLNTGFMFADVKYSNSSTYSITSYNYLVETAEPYQSKTTVQTNTNTITMPIAAFQISLGLTYRF